MADTGFELWDSLNDDELKIIIMNPHAFPSTTRCFAAQEYATRKINEQTSHTSTKLDPDVRSEHRLSSTTSGTCTQVDRTPCIGDTMRFMFGRNADWDDAYDEYEDDRADLARLDRDKRRYFDRLCRHPNPQDPDHPEPWDEDE